MFPSGAVGLCGATRGYDIQGRRRDDSDACVADTHGAGSDEAVIGGKDGAGVNAPLAAGQRPGVITLPRTWKRQMPGVPTFDDVHTSRIAIVRDIGSEK